MTLKKILSLILICAFISNAADDATSRTSSISAPAAIKPTFYDEPMVRLRDGAVQTPVNLEGPIDSNYIVGPGDFFEIILPNQQEGLQVSPEGTVAIQGHGLVEINGLPLYEAKRKILEKLKNRYDQRFIGVHLVQLRRFIVNVQGAVHSPGQVTVSGQARVKGAIYAAGNFRPWANRDSVYIYRMGDTIASAENMLLKAGDIVMVPGRDWHQTIDISHSGKTLTIPYTPDRTLKEYVKEAGINIEDGYKEISVKYVQDAGFTRWINVNQISSFVPEPLAEIEFHIQAPFVYVGGAVLTVGKVPYNSSMRAVDYVAASGVTIITGSFSRVSVLRNGKKVSVDWATGEILPGDFIEIPRTLYEQTKDFTIFVTSVLSIIATAIIIRSN